MNSIKLVLLVLLFSLSNAYAVFGGIPKPKAPKASDPQVIIPNLKAEKQQTAMWCWAASTRMLLSSKVQNLPSQCEMASTVFNRDCCKNPKEFKCVRGFHIIDALKKLGFEGVEQRAAYNPNAHWSKRFDNEGWYNSVVDSLKEGHPVVITHYNNSGTEDISSHAIVAYGTYRQKGHDFIVAFDPLTGKTKFLNFNNVWSANRWIVTTKLK